MKNIYQFGFYKYWDNCWEEDYYIAEDDPQFIEKIKSTLMNSILIDSINPLNKNKIEYIIAIQACTCILDFKKVTHWHQVNISMSFKFIELL